MTRSFWTVRRKMLVPTGVAVAATVLAGDFLLARAAFISASVENFRVMRLFSEMLMIICEGEIRQDFGRAQFPPSQKNYYDHIESKTAALFRGPE